MKNLKNTTKTKAKTSGHGGRRKGAGRKKGVPNRLTAALKERAMIHAMRAIERMGKLSVGAKSEMVQIAAGNALLNRGFGRPGVAVADGGDMPAARIEHLYRWARSEEEATTDPAHATGEETPRPGAKETGNGRALP